MSSLKKIHYIGTDPNTDNFIDELGISRYEYANFFNNEALESNPFGKKIKYISLLNGFRTYRKPS